MPAGMPLLHALRLLFGSVFSATLARCINEAVVFTSPAAKWGIYCSLLAGAPLNTCVTPNTLLDSHKWYWSTKW